MARIASPNRSLHIRRGDLALVRSGNDRGRRGRVLAVATQTGRVTIEGVHLVTRHVRPKAKQTPVGRVEQPAPIAAANVQLICPHCDQPTRRVMSVSNGRRSARCHRCHEPLAERKDQA